MKAKKTRPTINPAPQWLVDAFQDADASPLDAEDDDCPICRAMREHADPNSIEVIQLEDGSMLEIAVVTSDAVSPTRR